MPIGQSDEVSSSIHVPWMPVTLVCVKLQLNKYEHKQMSEVCASIHKRLKGLNSLGESQFDLITLLSPWHLRLELSVGYLIFPLKVRGEVTA